MMVMDRLADLRSALQPAECVLQNAMDHAGEGADDIRSNLEEVLMWAKGPETMQALPNGLDALLERRLDDAVRETAELDSENSFPLKSIRLAARVIIGAGASSSRACAHVKLPLTDFQRDSARKRRSRHFLRRYRPCEPAGRALAVARALTRRLAG